MKNPTIAVFLFFASSILFMAQSCATKPPRQPERKTGVKPKPAAAVWWTYHPGRRECVRSSITPEVAKRDALNRGAACRRLRSFDPDAFILMCTRSVVARTGEQKLKVRIAGFGRDRISCKAAGKDVVRHLNEIKRKEG